MSEPNQQIGIVNPNFNFHWWHLIDFLFSCKKLIHIITNIVLSRDLLLAGPGNFSGPRSHSLVNLYLKTEVYTPEPSCMKGTSGRIKKLWIKQLFSQKVWDFATAFQVRKLLVTFEKRGTKNCDAAWLPLVSLPKGPKDWLWLAPGDMFMRYTSNGV